MRSYMKAAGLLTAAAMSFSILAGCGKTDAPTDGSETAPTEQAQTEQLAEVYENPDWSYGQVAIGGGGFVTGIVSTCEAGLFYARTDVGGAYRWDNEAQKWIALNYDISEDDKGLLGIDGIAVDPNNAANVYLAAGTSYFSNAKTCILVSHDYGEHFKQVDVSDLIKVHGNGMGRGNGERIAVDPNNSDIIYCGGRTGGMIRSLDAGETWQKVESFPVNATANENGINIILFDKERSRIYVGVSQSKAENIYYSDDSGESWSVLPGSEEASQRYMPQRFDLNSKGELFVSYGNKEGPWNSVQGTLYKYSPDNGTAEEIQVVSWTVGDIVIDPKNDDNMVLVTSEVWKEQPNGAFGDKFFRTTDGGKTWEDLDGKYTMSTNGMDWISNAAIHWCSSLAMDSGNSDRILVNSGNGIFACDNIWDDAPEFYFEANGIEEVVPEDIVSYADYPLITAIGDFDGFIHEDIFTSAERHSKQIGSCTSIAVAALNNDIWAKVGGDESNMLLTYTTDGGKTWSDITNSPDPGKVLYKGKVALTADGSALIWSPSNSLFAYRTEDWGSTWEKVEGIAGNQGVYLIGDPVNKDYVYGSSNGTVYVSSDSGKSFKKKYDTSSKYKRLAIAPGIEGTFYVPGGGSGLLVSTDHGENFSLVPGLKFCDAVGLGKPKNDGGPYVIYVSGIPKEEGAVKGFYMSEDNGESWVRINDDLHQFGGIGNGEFVSGDMNVYGRCYIATVGLGIAYCDKNEK
ncbi:WD40/YVTN/BNR-like repeat-containing protein [Huintestinicola sp.]|uniref:WD40/YVTN/BNR-like repeat-containing protein n=1 Tax=Huintestinicola sp. TaxID=2981661 RepID=UPI003D7EFABE